MNRYKEVQEKLQTAISLYKANGGAPAHLSISDLELLMAMCIRLNRIESRADPRQAVLVESGSRLDDIGAGYEIDLCRNGSETDHDYRNRLIERMREVDAPQNAGD